MISTSNELTKAWCYHRYQGAVLFDPYAKEIASYLKQHGDAKIVLELACGTGRATAHIRKSLPLQVTLIASDIDHEMLTVAQQNLKSEQIDWQMIDAQKLPFQDDSIDVIVCCFGYMFTDFHQACREAYRALKPGGRLLFTTWDSLEFNPIQRIFRKVVSNFFKAPLDIKYLKPFSLNDDDFIRGTLSFAGFTLITLDHLKKEIDETQIKLLIVGMTYGSSISEEISRRCPEQMPEIISSATERIRMELNASTIEASARALICSAYK